MFAKGTIGEFLVGLSLRLLPKNTYHVFNDVTFEVMDGTTQIDHIVVSRFGVFVIETKSMAGKIYGRPGDKTWTQFFSKSKKFQFQNPIRQNYRHLKCLEELTGFDGTVHHSTVCFVGSATFKNELPSEVTQGFPLGRILMTRQKELLCPQQVREYVAILKMTAMPKSEETRKKHLASLSNRRKTA